MIWWVGVALAGPSAFLVGAVRELGSGLPVVGATVGVGPVSVVADDRGHFELVLPPGEVEVAVSAEDHRGATFRELLDWLKSEKPLPDIVLQIS